MKFQFHASAARSLNNTSAPGQYHTEERFENAPVNVSSYGINGSDYVVGVGMAFGW